MSRKARNYLDQLLSLLHRGEKPGRRDKRPAKSNRPRAASRGARQEKPGNRYNRNREALDAKLKELAANRNLTDSFVAGKVHLFNLEMIRERMGDRWAKLSDHIHEVIRTELANRLAARDFFTQVDIDSYVIVFGDCPEAEARLKVAILSEQILEKLFGADEAKDLQKLGVQTVVAKTDGDVAVEALDGTDALMRVLDQAESEQREAGEYPEGDPETGKKGLTPEEVARLLGEVDEHLRSYEETESPADYQAATLKVDRIRALVRQLKNFEEVLVRQWSEIPRRERRAPAADWAGSLDDTLESIADLRKRGERQLDFLTGAGREREELDWNPGDPVDIAFEYLPMWHVPSEKIGIYLCQANVRGAVGKVLYPSPRRRSADDDFLAVIDRLVLYRAREDLGKAIEARRPYVVGVPVHLSTFRRPGNRDRLLELCWNIPEAHRDAIVWEIQSAAVDSWSLQLAEVVKVIGRFSSALFLRIEGLPERFQFVRNNLHYVSSAGVRAVGLDVSDFDCSESETLEILEHLAEVADESGLQCYAHGFETLSLTTSAICMGYQHTSGPAIAGTVIEPKGIRRSGMKSLYDRIVFGKSRCGAA